MLFGRCLGIPNRGGLYRDPLKSASNVFFGNIREEFLRICKKTCCTTSFCHRRGSNWRILSSGAHRHIGRSRFPLLILKLRPTRVQRVTRPEVANGKLVCLLSMRLEGYRGFGPSLEAMSLRSHT